MTRRLVLSVLIRTSQDLFGTKTMHCSVVRRKAFSTLNGQSGNCFRFSKMSSMQAADSRRPISCDTFVVLPPATSNGCVIFGKNSDRSSDEVQEVVHIPAMDHDTSKTLQCTYVDILQVPHTHAVILSKPAWMWGAEMGANEHGVCIGNEAVWTKMNGPQDKEEKLLGMDLVRLALERSYSAEIAVQVLTSMLSLYGQGGNNAEERYEFLYHNSFIVADRRQAFVVESLGNQWAVENITSGYRNISNQLTIRTKIDKMSDGLLELAQKRGWWSPDQGDLDFAKTFSDFEDTELAEGGTPDSRQLWGTKLMRDLSSAGTFKVKDMLHILRHQESGICMTGGMCSTGSQVSLLPPADTGAPCVHFFTATANPHQSLYKPFVFCDNPSIGDNTVSPSFGDKDPAKVVPRFQSKVDRRHPLWAAHESFESLLHRRDPKGGMLLEQIREMEANSLEDIDDIIAQGKLDGKATSKLSHLFKHMVDLEMNFYKMS